MKKHFKKLILVGAVVLAVGATSVTALAVSGTGTPAEIVAGLTGKTVETVVAEKTQSGQTYGALASAAGKLDEFKTQMMEQKKELLNEKVAAGTMTQERATAIVAAMEQNQANCDGTGAGNNGAGAGTCTGTGAGTGAAMGAGFGGLNGNKQGSGQGGSGLGTGARNGQGGSGLGTGACAGQAES